MTNNSSLLLGVVFFVLSLTNCTTPSRNSSPEVKEEAMTVEIKDFSERNIPKISNNQTQSPFGPLPDGPSEELSKEKKSIKVPSALIISAGLYRSISTISLLRELKNIDRVPPVILGHGMSAAIASYFALGFEADFIEWKFFQFLEKAKGLKPFESEWSRVYEKVLLKELEKKQIEDAGLTLLIPIWNVKKRKTEFLKRGPLKEALMANVNYYKQLGKHHSPAMSFRFVDRPQLETMGIKKLYVVDILNNGISWIEGSGLLNGFFQKGASVILDEKLPIDAIIEYPISEFELDNAARAADLIFLSKEWAKTHLSHFTKEDEI